MRAGGRAGTRAGRAGGPRGPACVHADGRVGLRIGGHAGGE